MMLTVANDIATTRAQFRPKYTSAANPRLRARTTP
ncbi:hypothetical protein RCH22_003447 [Cryobacterium psychrotolerans]|nr:hypothetical protein [Cryobacterium psychrotolerans]